jgi:hypothetical protein
MSRKKGLLFLPYSLFTSSRIGREGTYTGGLFLSAKPFSTKLALDLPGKEGWTFILQLGDPSYHWGCGQTWLAPPNTLGFQGTCAVVTP